MTHLRLKLQGPIASHDAIRFPADLLIVNPEHVVTVLGTSVDPDAGDTGAILTLVTGEKFEVVHSAGSLADMFDEAAKNG